MRHRLVIVLLRLALVIAASVAAGCSSGTSDTNTTTADATSSTAFAIDTTTTAADGTSLPTIAEGAQTIDPSAALLWEPCSWGECATLAVPLDHDDPGAGTIDLSLARRVALAPD
jgi:hypothetical protein